MLEQKIKESLMALMDGIKRADDEAVARGMSEIEGYLGPNRKNLHPQLAHFLERRSYAKALMFLGGEAAIPKGSCGGER